MFRERREKRLEGIFMLRDVTIFFFFGENEIQNSLNGKLSFGTDANIFQFSLEFLIFLSEKWWKNHKK